MQGLSRYAAQSTDLHRGDFAGRDVFVQLGPPDADAAGSLGDREADEGVISLRAGGSSLTIARAFIAPNGSRVHG